MATLEHAEQAFAALIANLSPASRRELAREMAKRLRQSQQKRIAAQQNADGSAYAPRLPQLRKKSGRIKKQMFAKLRTAKYLKAKSSTASASVEFTSNVARIARVHQYGLRDRVSKGGPEAQYPRRELLGLSDEDLRTVEEMVLSALAK
ncbi:phage virion morphogenesis protein [Craterilacuibacter sp. RT1T]|uniref:phage virion morphogenesis protein n=1 Tax=Craterilacuibacter sp. RT1T TaxID=2942211 RepID=UPI0020BF7D75|nr:phage virion morphogenesis protein [Craterilacuibacter sp. RT1T]